jgi:hypothetical protein
LGLRFAMGKAFFVLFLVKGRLSSGGNLIDNSLCGHASDLVRVDVGCRYCSTDVSCLDLDLYHVIPLSSCTFGIRYLHMSTIKNHQLEPSYYVYYDYELRARYLLITLSDLTLVFFLLCPFNRA